MVTTTSANLYVLEPCLNELERDTLRHFLGLLLEADEPEAMVASLRRLAERKAWHAVRGALADRHPPLALRACGCGPDRPRQLIAIEGCDGRGLKRKPKENDNG
jgi:hypothetical protein